MLTCIVFCGSCGTNTFPITSQCTTPKILSNNKPINSYFLHRYLVMDSCNYLAHQQTYDKVISSPSFPGRSLLLDWRIALWKHASIADSSSLELSNVPAVVVTTCLVFLIIISGATWKIKPCGKHTRSDNSVWKLEKSIPLRAVNCILSKHGYVCFKQFTSLELQWFHSNHTLVILAPITSPPNTMLPSFQSYFCKKWVFDIFHICDLHDYNYSS